MTSTFFRPGDSLRTRIAPTDARVLITGEVANERDKALIAEVVSQVENVSAVQNELEITNSPTLRERAADTVEKADMSTHELQYMYHDGHSYHFMNNASFEMLELRRITDQPSDAPLNLLAEFVDALLPESLGAGAPFCACRPPPLWPPRSQPETKTASSSAAAVIHRTFRIGSVRNT